MEQYNGMPACQERRQSEKLEAKIGAEIKTIREIVDSNQETMDGGQEQTKAQVGSLTLGSMSTKKI
jgi:hypothetical protein